MCKVAVIMSVYYADNSSYLKEAINSIVNQSYNEVDLFLYIDGAISEDLVEVIEFFKCKFINRIKVYRGCYNKGLAFGLNLLIDEVLSRGKYKYVARMDADDISHSERIRKQVEFMQDHIHVSVIGSACKEFGASFALSEKRLPDTHEALKAFSVARCPFIHPTVMFRVSVFKDGCRYSTETALTEDMALWFELLKKGYKFANLTDVLLDYRLNEQTIKRRRGFYKCLSEINLRLKYMRLLNEVTVKNFLLISSRILFHFAPPALLKFAYRNLR
ncbi:glycosyltransferase [Pseudoalteromonas sp. CO342X]|uniref:glycosyltransferase n=1 Tax=Pseudoalteromonas sp. CO342X TaxID=1777270 RepID=UPI00102321EF|nr:glycosyltransferase [Pseudoalteromonas sp. CO342X]RZG14242.1 glycosyltransferase [Pseudoalteromonas sp. CO342X]